MYDRVQGMSAEAAEGFPTRGRRAANGAAASPARSDAGRRRGRDERAACALSLPARAVRARMPDRLVPEDQQAKSKLIVLDANPQSPRRARCSRASGGGYAGPRLSRQCDGDRSRRRGKNVHLGVGDRVKGDVLNLIPPMRAADIARDARLVTANERWCEVDWTTMESVAVKDVHVLGDATLSAPGMPKSVTWQTSTARRRPPRSSRS